MTRPIVHVRPAAGGRPVEAELHARASNGRTVKVVYTASRTGAWVAVGRVIDLPAEPEPTQPTPATPVWVAEPLAGVTMHRTVNAGRRTGCDKPAFGGVSTTAGTARERWGARVCTDCWPVTS